MTFADSRLFTLDRLSTFYSRLSTFYSRLSTFYSRLSTLDFLLSTFTLDSRLLLSTVTLDSRPLLSTLDPRLLDTLQNSRTYGLPHHSACLILRSLCHSSKMRTAYRFLYIVRGVAFFKYVIQF
jgi:hypothetical protein